jgi:hypothetical protein
MKEGMKEGMMAVMVKEMKEMKILVRIMTTVQ